MTDGVDDYLPTELKRKNQETVDDYKLRLLDVAVRNPGPPEKLTCVLGLYRELEITLQKQLMSDLAWRKYSSFQESCSAECKSKSSISHERLTRILESVRQLSDETWKLHQQLVTLCTKVEVMEASVPAEVLQAIRSMKRPAFSKALELIKDCF